MKHTVVVTVNSGPFAGKKRRVGRELLNLHFYHRRSNCLEVRVGDYVVAPKYKISTHVRSVGAPCPRCIKRREDRQ